MLATLPETPRRAQQELDLQVALGPAFMVTRGPASPAVEQVYARAQELCQQVGETPQLFPVLWGLWRRYNNRCEYQRARALGEQLLSLAQQVHDAALLLEAHHALWATLFFTGEFTSARAHLEQGRALYDPQQHHAYALLYGGHDTGVCCLSVGACVLWLLGYPDQALQAFIRRSSSARSLRTRIVWLAPCTLLPSSTSFVVRGRQPRSGPRWRSRSLGSRVRPMVGAGNDPAGLGAGLAGTGSRGLAQMCQGLSAHRATGAEQERTYFLALLAEGYRGTGEVQEGLCVLAEALAAAHNRGERYCEAELHRLKANCCSCSLRTSTLRPKPASTALAIARRQQAKSLELRAAMSLSRLWQQQDKRMEAHALLAPIYGWFTEGFDTADLQEAKAARSVRVRGTYNTVRLRSPGPPGPDHGPAVLRPSIQLIVTRFALALSAVNLDTQEIVQWTR